MRNTQAARLAPLAVPAAGFCVAAGYVLLAQSFGAASRAIPQLVGTVTAVLCVMDVVSRTDTPAGHALSRWLNPAGEAGSADGPVPHRHRQALAVVGVAALAAAMVLAGLLPAVAAFGFLALRFRAGRSFLASAVTAAVLAGAVWVLFHLLLNLRLFPGLLFGGEW